MDLEMALKNLSMEMNALEMEIRSRGFVLAGSVADEEPEPAGPRIADTRVGYFGIWE